MSFLVKYIKNKKVSVLGAGTSGIAAAKLLDRNGVEVFISENQPLKYKMKEKEILDTHKIPHEFGGHTDLVFRADVIVVSPGILLDDSLLKKIKENNIKLFGELEIASWYCKAPIIAVTGSNGKSTTTELIGNIFEKAGRKYEVAGNIGNPFSDIADSIEKDSTAVIEVSSFQLETIKSFHPKVAIFLNLTPDHLDRHGSMKVYGSLKARIFQNQTAEDYLIYNSGDPLVSKLVKKGESKKIPLHTKHTENACGYIEKEKLNIKIKQMNKELIALSEMKLKGQHNALNALAAALCARIFDIDWTSIKTSLKTFTGLPHRMEFVRKRNKVVWINDSKATNVDSVWYALESFNTPVILIAGGRDKDADFSKLYEQVKRTVKLVILMGEAAQKMKEVFENISVRIVKSMKDAVEVADQTAESGDTILLSPSCTSFDMFSSFEERGNTFKTLVNNL